MNVRAREQWTGFATIVRREIRRFVRIWPQTLLPPAITMSLYFVIFGALIGKRIGQMGGYSYMEFVVPGLIMMAVVTNAYSNVVSSFFGAKFHRFVEEMLVSPLSDQVILLGFVVGGIARGLMVGLLVSVVAILFTDLSVHNIGITLSILILTSMLFALGGFINAVFAENFDDISIVPNFVLTPLTYLGGVFYSIDLVPDFWADLSRLNPMLYIINAFRYGILGISDVPVGLAFAIVGIATVLAYGYAVYLLKTGTRLRQ